MAQSSIGKHPPGLLIICITEGLERFAFYGMQSLLTLYMADDLLRPGHAHSVPGLSFLLYLVGRQGGPESSASRIFGLFTAFAYITPVLGSLLADRRIGRHAAVLAGCVVLAAGHFSMAAYASFVPALALLVMGCGLMKGNIAAQVGNLYTQADPRRSLAYGLFSMAISFGVIAAPLICGTLAVRVGYHAGFAAAGVALIAAGAVYVRGRAQLPSDPLPAHVSGHKKLTAAERKTVLVLLFLLPLFAALFVGNNQVYNMYQIWARDAAALSLAGWRFPVSYLISFDAAISATMFPVAAWFWRRLAARGILPNDLRKLILGGCIDAFACLYLAAWAQWGLSTGAKIPLLALLGFHTLNSAGFALVLPAGLALFSRNAPVSLGATMMGSFYLLFFGTNLMVGWIGALYPSLGHGAFWLIQTGIVAAPVLLFTLLYRPLHRVLT